MNTARLLEVLEGVRANGDGWIARCPVPEHGKGMGDRNASLSVAEKENGWPRIHCFAGCQDEDVLAVLGLRWADLKPEVADGNRAVANPPRSRPRPSPPNPEAGNAAPLPSEEDAQGWAARLLANDGLVERLRELRGWTPDALRRLEVGFDGKRLTLPVRDAEGAIVNLCRYSPNPKGEERKMLALKGRPRGLYPPPEQLPTSERIWIVEGEPDAISAAVMGLSATAVPGVQNWRADYADRFAGREVVICCDCDKQGRELAAKIAADLGGKAKSLRVLDLEQDRDDGFDLSDHLQEASQGGAQAVAVRAALLNAYADSAPEAQSAPEEPGALLAPEPLPETAAPTTDWPAPLGGQAFHGLAGQIVRMIEPSSEADPAALLIQLLGAFGSAAGRGPGFQVEGNYHPPRLFAVVVGDTSKARKGTSWGRVLEVMQPATRAASDPDWASRRIANGLSTGEGLIAALKNVSDEEDEDLVPDEDKRLLVFESEFAQVLKVMRREGNTLSPVLRTLWDSDHARTMTRQDPLEVRKAHVSVLGHITQTELRSAMNATESANGFANRFLFVCATRARKLPFGGRLDQGLLEPLVAQLAECIKRALRSGPMEFAPEARDRWVEIYDDLSEGHPGQLGAVTSRSEAQTLRLAVAYALLDQSQRIELAHLEAALEVWRYCFESAAHIFGRSTGNPLAERIGEMLEQAGAEGLTRGDLRKRLSHNTPTAEIDTALQTLQQAGRLRPPASEGTGGRPAQRWRAR